MKNKQLAENTYHVNQSWYYDQIIQRENATFRVAIRRNAYDTQSSAKVERWDGEKWQWVYGEPITKCKCRNISYVDRTVTSTDFREDADRLFAVAFAIAD